MAWRSAFCAEVSLELAEPLAATASRVDNWLLVEYRGQWGHDALGASALPDEVKSHLRRLARELPRTKLLFVRRAERRHLPGLAVFWGTTPERGGELFHAHLDHPEDLLDFDPTGAGEPAGHPLLLVCTHGKHDRCCARLGRPLYDALREQVDDDWVWQCSHVGGDRFAGNLVCLPEGLYFGRVGPGDAWTVIDEYLAGRIDLERYRGRACYPFRIQAAERAVRDETGLRGIPDLELLSADPVRFRAGGRVYDVEVSAEDGPLMHLTCSAEELRHPQRYAARILRESAA
jgi:hypothetical protein